MRILGKLAVAAGATAAILLVAPAANAEGLEQVTQGVGAADQKIIPGLPGLSLLNQILNPVAGGLTGGALQGTGVSGLGG